MTSEPSPVEGRAQAAGGTNLGELLQGFTRDELLALARNPDVEPERLDQIGRWEQADDEILQAVLTNPRSPLALLVEILRTARLSLLSFAATERAILARGPEVGEAILANRHVTEEIREAVLRLAPEVARRQEAEERKKSLLVLIKGLTTGQKLALAKKGNKDARMILIKDPNEMVALEVANSPRVTDQEILSIAQMRDVSDKVLRSIANNKRYRSNHLILLALLNNPKTPVGVSLGLGINALSDKELEGLAKNRNIPAAVARAAKHVLDRRKAPPPAAAGGSH